MPERRSSWPKPGSTALPRLKVAASGHVYLCLKDESAVLDVIRSPLVSWIWAGSVLLILGVGRTGVVLITAEQVGDRVDQTASAALAADDVGDAHTVVADHQPDTAFLLEQPQPDVAVPVEGIEEAK